MNNNILISLKRKYLQFKMRRLHKKREWMGSIKNEGRDRFYAHLLEQEVIMWVNYPETFTMWGYYGIVRRRGFNIREQHCLLLILYKLGFDVKHFGLIDLKSEEERMLAYLERMFKPEIKTMILPACKDAYVLTDSYKDKQVNEKAVGTIQGVNIN